MVVFTVNIESRLKQKYHMKIKIGLYAKILNTFNTDILDHGRKKIYLQSKCYKITYPAINVFFVLFRNSRFTWSSLQ